MLVLLSRIGLFMPKPVPAIDLESNFGDASGTLRSPSYHRIFSKALHQLASLRKNLLFRFGQETVYGVAQPGVPDSARFLD